LDRWAQVVAHYLKPGGIFYIVDDHPVNIFFLFEEENISYFDTSPQRYVNTPDYCDRSYLRKSETVEWQHTLSSIVNAFVRAGLTIELLNEFNKGYYQVHEDWYESDGYWYPPGGPPPYPLMFSMRARKGA
jgi:hypothetical protein